MNLLSLIFCLFNYLYETPSYSEHGHDVMLITGRELVIKQLADDEFNVEVYYCGTYEGYHTCTERQLLLFLKRTVEEVEDEMYRADLL